MNKLINRNKYFQKELLCEQFQDWNFQKLSSEKTDKDKTALNFFKIQEEQLMDLMDKIPSLKNNKIIKVLGNGAFGIAYLLDNDHIFKLFNDGMNDYEKYINIYNDQFNGISTATTPVVYDYGFVTIAFPPKSDGHIYHKKINYVEIGKVIPILDWIKQTKQNKNAWETLINSVDSFMWRTRKNKTDRNWKNFQKQMYLWTKRDLQFKISQPVDVRYPDADDVKNAEDAELKKTYHKYTRIVGVPKSEQKAFFDDYLNYIKRYPTKSDFDLHLGNFGVLPYKNGIKFIFFDI